MSLPERIAALHERQEERIRTLEDALRPFAEAGHELDEYRFIRREGGLCATCRPRTPWPCMYETARRALEGE